jgi:hypothetical protein
MNESPAGDRQGLREDRAVTVRLEGFAWEALQEESTRLNVPLEELVAFAVLYYLADADSGRVARRITESQFPQFPQAS